MGKFDLGIEQEKRRILDWKVNYGQEVAEYYTLINYLLKEGSISKLVQLFEEETFKQNFFCDSDIALLSIILNIYQTECSDGITQTILDGVESINQAKNIFLNMKFLIWQIEFQEGETENTSIGLFIKDKQVSLPFLKYVIHTSSFDKVNTSFKLAMVLKELDMYGKAFGMLKYVNELCPGEELVYCEMADICFYNKQYLAAEDCLKMIQEPSALLERYRKRWGI